MAVGRVLERTASFMAVHLLQGSLMSCKGQPASWLCFCSYSFALTNGSALGWQLMTPRECSARLQEVDGRFGRALHKKDAS